MTLQIVRRTQFKKDLKKLKSRGVDLSKIESVVSILMRGDKLPRQYNDHAMHGKWRNARNAHVMPDWILIYRIADGKLRLIRTGSHADLF